MQKLLHDWDFYTDILIVHSAEKTDPLKQITSLNDLLILES